MQYIKHNQEFQAHYIKEIQPHLNELEKGRIKSLSKFKLYAALAAIFSLAVFFIILTFFPSLIAPKDNFEFLLIILSFTFFPAFYVINNYKKRGKKLIIPKILTFLGNFYYREEDVFSKENLKLFKEILPVHTSLNIDDNIMGQKNDVMIKIADAKCTIRRNKRTRITFQGLLIKVSFNKNFKGKTIICRDTGTVGNFFSKTFSSLENIKLEDPLFESKFEVFGTDQVEARYILTTAFMERLLKLNKMAKEAITCTFYNQNMYLTLPLGKNSFETTSLFESAYSSDKTFEVLNQFNEIFEIIEILKLNENIGM